MTSKLRSIIITLVLTLLVIGCASSKKSVYSPAGTWDYVVYETPNGDSSGNLILVETEEGIKGTLSSSELGEADLNNLVFSGEEKSLAASFWLSMANMDFLLNGTFEGDTFIGTVDAGEMGVFEMKAIRQVAQ